MKSPFRKDEQSASDKLNAAQNAVVPGWPQAPRKNQRQHFDPA
jgi:hypothetical protein